jgi:cytochrome oxidase assembly protein ShyY1
MLPTIVTAFLLYVMVSLGQWQYNKGEYINNLQQKINDRRQLSPVSMQELPQSLEDQVFVPVIVSGTFDTEHHFYFDNRIVNGFAGYDIYTPFRMEDGRTFLVNRGWLQQGRTRQDLPEFETESSRISFKALVDRPPSKDFMLAENVHSQLTWPMVLQYVDTTEISEMLGYELMPTVLRLDRDADHGFHREIPVLNLDSAKNTGYAFQWYAMSAALLVIYIAVNIRKSNDSNETVKHNE